MPDSEGRIPWRRVNPASLNGKLTLEKKAGGENPEMLHRADLKERIAATPDLVGNKVYLHTETKLYAFKQDGE